MKKDSTNYMVYTKNLSIGYKGREIVRDINIFLKKGNFISILGPNGAGKTTLLRTLCRLLPPIKGEVFIKNIPFSSITHRNMSKFVSVVLTEKVIPPLFKVKDFVALGRYPYSNFLGLLRDKDKKQIYSSLTLVGAQHLAEKFMENLSDGERQKVMIARALAQDPEIIFLDEPTIHLDLKHKMEVISILQQLCSTKKITVIASLHDVDLAMRVSDFVILIKEGKIVAQGTPEEILTSEKVSSLYNFNRINFDPLLGVIQIPNPNTRGHCFIIGGMGKASVLYRIVARKGYKIKTGILYENDVDYFVAKGLGAQCITQRPFSNNNREKLIHALSIMKKCNLIIDADGYFPNNDINFHLLRMALKENLNIITFKSPEDINKIVPLQDLDNFSIVYAKNISKLSELI